MAREFPEPWEIPVTQEFPRLKLFPPVSQEMGISPELPACGFLLNIPALGEGTPPSAIEVEAMVAQGSGF